MSIHISLSTFCHVFLGGFMYQANTKYWIIFDWGKKLHGFQFQWFTKKNLKNVKWIWIQPPSLWNLWVKPIDSGHLIFCISPLKHSIRDNKWNLKIHNETRFQIMTIPNMWMLLDQISNFLLYQWLILLLKAVT